MREFVPWLRNRSVSETITSDVLVMNRSVSPRGRDERPVLGSEWVQLVHCRRCSSSSSSSRVAHTYLHFTPHQRITRTTCRLLALMIVIYRRSEGKLKVKSRQEEALMVNSWKWRCDQVNSSYLSRDAENVQEQDAQAPASTSFTVSFRNGLTYRKVAVRNLAVPMGLV